MTLSRLHQIIAAAKLIDRGCPNENRDRGNKIYARDNVAVGADAMDSRYARGHGHGPAPFGGEELKLRDFIVDRVVPRDSWVAGVLWHIRQAKRYFTFDVLSRLKVADGAKFRTFDELTQARAIGKRSRHLISVTGKARNGSPRVLFFSMRAFSLHLAWESVLAAALELRGADCLFYTCSGGLPICGRTCMESSVPTPCSTCAPYSKAMFENFGHKIRRLNDYASPGEIALARNIAELLEPAQLEEFTYKGLPLGRLVKTSVVHVFHAAYFKPDAAMITVYKSFLASGIVMADACVKLLDEYRPNVVCMLNGILFAESILYELAVQRSINVITHEVGTRVNTIVFSRKRNIIFDPDVAWKQYGNIPLDTKENTCLDLLMESRKRSEGELIRLWLHPDEDVESVRACLQMDQKKPVVLLFTNLMWDTSLIDQNIVFKDAIDWLLRTVGFFFHKPEVQLVIRVHPAEVRSDGHIPKEKMTEIISASFPKLPPHIKVIPPDSDISSYVLMSMAASAIVYVSSAGLEMATMGKPVIVPSRVHYGRKGFTYNVKTSEEYFRLLENVSSMPPLSEVQVELARRYAYLFYAQMMIPFRFVYHQPLQAPRFTFTDLSELAPGKDAILDHICNAIINGEDFALPRELIRHASN
ncbi:MAG: hypothetical protein HY663_04440 [Chloroflexi bacterium]|nr:hypothetical protein [Chloroflexota bacterium]